MQHLKTCYLFRFFDEDELAELNGFIKIHHWTSGEKIFSQGDEVTSLYHIISGSIVFGGEIDSLPDNIAVYSTGHTFGEMGLYGDHYQEVDAKVLEESEVYEIKFDDLLQYFSLNFRASYKFHHNLISNLSNLNHRLVKELLYLMDSSSVSGRLNNYV